MNISYYLKSQADDARFLTAECSRGASIHQTMLDAWIDPSAEHAYFEVSGDDISRAKVASK